MLASDLVDVATWGETMAMLRADGGRPLRQQTNLELSIGGCESNVATGLARLGHRTRWVGTVGADELGELILGRLRAEGVELSASQSATAPTGLAIKELRRAREQHVHYYRAGSAAAVTPLTGAQIAALLDARFVHLSGITPALGPVPLSTIREVLSRERGGLVSFDVNYRSRLWPHQQAGPVLRSLITHVDLLFVSWDEVPVLLDDAVTGGPPAPESPAMHRTIQRLHDLGCEHVVLKLGAMGAVASVDGRSTFQPAIATEVLDEVGAGDAFAAGYLSGLLRASTTADALALATRCAMKVISARGDWEGAPTYSELRGSTGPTVGVVR